MKKIIGTLFVLVLTAIVPVGASAQSSGGWCYNFSEILYFGREGAVKSLLTWSDAYRQASESEHFRNIIKRIDADTRAVQKVLELEGYAVPSDEKNQGEYGLVTTSAVVQLQNKYSSQILTGSGYASGTGVVIGKTLNFLNQKYGCINKAVIDLTEPNGSTVKARGEVLPIKWNASNIPNEATLTISYVKSDNTGTTTLSTQTIKNGAGSYNWTIPNTLVTGSYKVLLSISGAVKSDISAKSFEVRETALELLTQNTSQTYSVNQVVNIAWKTSVSITPTALLKIQMVGSVPANSNDMLAIYDIATVKNTGTYAWTVPEKMGNVLVATGAPYKILISTTNGSGVADYSNSTFTINNFVRQVSFTAPAASTTVMQGETVTLQWNQSNLVGNAVITAREKTSSATPVVQDFGPVAVTSGSKTITIPLTLKPATYVFTIQNTTAGIQASSSREFVVSPKTRSVSVIGPNGGERVGTTTQFNIAWSATGIDSSVKNFRVNLVDTVANKTVLIKDVSVNDRGISFVVPINGVLGNLSGIGTYADARYKVELQVIATNGAVLISDQSNAAFTINRNTPSLQVVTPTSTTKFEIGGVIKTEWSYTNVLVPARAAVVELLNASGGTAQVLSVPTTRLDSKTAQAVLANTVPAGNYKIRISSVLVDGTQIQAESGVFEITNKIPAVTVTVPNTSVEFKMKNALPVVWTVKNLPSTANSYEIHLIDTVTNKTQKITSLGKTASSFNWVIPSNGILGIGENQITGIGDVTTKKYKIEVRSIDVAGTQVAKDQSDVPFAIVR